MPSDDPFPYAPDNVLHGVETEPDAIGDAPTLGRRIRGAGANVADPLLQPAFEMQRPMIHPETIATISPNPR